MLSTDRLGQTKVEAVLNLPRPGQGDATQAQHQAFWEKGADATGAREVTPSWVRGHGPSALPDPSRGNRSPDSRTELTEISQHNAGAARTVSAANEANHRAPGAKAHKPTSTKRHLSRESSPNTGHASGPTP